MKPKTATQTTNITGANLWTQELCLLTKTITISAVKRLIMIVCAVLCLSSLFRLQIFSEAYIHIVVISFSYAIFVTNSA